MLKIDSKSTDLKDFIYTPHVYGVANRGLHIGGCFFIVDIAIYSCYRALRVEPGTVSTERIRVLIRVSSSLINTITIDSSQTSIQPCLLYLTLS
jgi:hypothetical protein